MTDQAWDLTPDAEGGEVRRPPMCNEPMTKPKYGACLAAPPPGVKSGVHACAIMGEHDRHVCVCGLTADTKMCPVEMVDEPPPGSTVQRPPRLLRCLRDPHPGDPLHRHKDTSWRALPPPSWGMDPVEEATAREVAARGASMWDRANAPTSKGRPS